MSRAKSAGPFVQQFIIDGQWYGEAPRSMDMVHDQPCPPSSLAFACPYCAEIWARCPVSLPDGQPHRFQIVTQACRKCPTTADRGQGIYGSLVCSWLPEFVDAFPKAVWRRELLHHLSLYPTES